MTMACQATLWGNCGSIACSVHDPSPLPPLWLFSMAYTCLPFFLFLFLFYRVSGGRRGRRGWGRAFWRRARGRDDNKQTKQGRGWGGEGVHVLLCVYAVLPKRILILATHPQKFCCLYLFDFFLWLFWQLRVTQKIKKRGRTCVVFVSSHVLLQTFWKEKKKENMM